MERKQTHNNIQPIEKEEDRLNHPEKDTIPEFNSSTKKRVSNNLPYIENLDHQIHQNLPKNPDKSPEKGYNDESLFGNNTKTDLGAGPRDADEDEDEKIIRT